MCRVSFRTTLQRAFEGSGPICEGAMRPDAQVIFVAVNNPQMTTWNGQLLTTNSMAVLKPRTDFSCTSFGINDWISLVVPRKLLRQTHWVLRWHHRRNRNRFAYFRQSAGRSQSKFIGLLESVRHPPLKSWLAKRSLFFSVAVSCSGWRCRDGEDGLMLSYSFPLSKNDKISMSHATPPSSFMILLYGAAAMKALCFFEVALVSK
jgi:hypothetical protein